MSVWSQPSPSDVDRAAERIANGERISEACQAEGFTLTQLRQCDRAAWLELKSLWHDVQGTVARTTAHDTFLEIATNSEAEDKDRIQAGVQLAKSSGYLTERVEVTGDGGGPVEVNVEHDAESVRRLLNKLVDVGLVRPGPAAALDTEAQPLLPARTD